MTDRSAAIRLGGSARRWARRTFFAVALAAELALIAWLWATIPQPAPRTVMGTVRCASGAPVVAIWVEGQRGGSWWVDELTPLPRDPAAAHYVKYLPGGGRYQLRVGCGGTAVLWASESHSDYLDDDRRDLVCTDPDNGDTFGQCR